MIKRIFSQLLFSAFCTQSELREKRRTRALSGLNLISLYTTSCPFLCHIIFFHFFSPLNLIPREFFFPPVRWFTLLVLLSEEISQNLSEVYYIYIMHSSILQQCQTCKRKSGMRHTGKKALIISLTPLTHFCIIHGNSLKWLLAQRSVVTHKSITIRKLTYIKIKFHSLFIQFSAHPFFFLIIIFFIFIFNGEKEIFLIFLPHLFNQEVYVYIYLLKKRFMDYQFITWKLHCR